jgi:hypothetical protein
MLSSFFNRSLKFESVHASQKCYFDNDLKRLWNAWLNLNLNFTRLELLFSIIFIQLLPCLFIWCESRLLRPFIVTASLLDLIIVWYLHLKPPLVFYIVLNLRVSSESWFSFTSHLKPDFHLHLIWNLIFIYISSESWFSFTSHLKVDFHLQSSSFSMDRIRIFIHNCLHFQWTELWSSFTKQPGSVLFNQRNCCLDRSNWTHFFTTHTPFL